MHIYFSGDEVDEVLDVKLDQMVKDRYGSEEARHLRRNFEETQIEMR